MPCQSFKSLIPAALLLTFSSVLAQNDELLTESFEPIQRIEAQATNKPLPSLAVAGAMAAGQFAFQSVPQEVPNMRFDGRPLPPDTVDVSTIEFLLQDSIGNVPTVVTGGFPGASNNDNAAVLGVLIAPPDTDGDVGPNHYVQMVNLLTTIYDKNGNIITPSFPSNAIWVGMGGNCQPFNRGDPVVLYDEQADRWLVSQFAFPTGFATFSQCVAISQTPDPSGAYNRYEFVFDSIGFNDYPKHGIVSDSITLMANLFTVPGFNFAGTFLGVMDKDAMYAGDTTATLIGQNLGFFEFGFVAGDLDGPGNAPALFATAMSRSNLFDIWQFDVDWDAQTDSLARIAAIDITAFDSDLCFAPRERCIPQPSGGPALEALSDRLMHRLQIRDFGTYRTMIASHTVDVGGGRAGIRWYEMRETGGIWALHQEGTYGPADGFHRWIPSAAMNAAGDIGIGYMVSSTTRFVSTVVAGQSAANSGTGILDGTETVCAEGTGVQRNTARAGDYSATNIDPTDDSFWHTNEVFLIDGNFQWATFVCNFTVSDGNIPPTAAFSSSCTDLDCLFTDLSTDSDGTVDAWSWDFGDTNTSTLQNPSHSYGAGGTFSVTLTVTDDDGATGSVTQDVTVTEANVAPTAAFSSSCTDLDCLFTDLSTDSDGTVDAWSWDFGDTNTSTLQNPSHSYGAGGTYSVTLTVTDDDGATGSVTQDVTVTEANVAPTAAFSSSCTDLDCLFTDLSTDSDGTVDAWSWDFGDTNTSTLQNPSHSYGAGGTYSVTLTVTDDDGATGSVTQDVTVTEANVAPTAAFSSSCTDLDCLFTDLSTDSDGTVDAWSWDFGDTNTSTLQNPSHSYGAGGTYSVTLTVTDDDGATGSVTQDVTVTEANVAPTAAFSSSCTDLDCLFTDLSTDSDGTVDAWSWDFGDTNTSTAQNPSHTYAAAGTFSVTLTVTDDDGATGSVTQDVTVTEANVAPTAAFSSSCTDLDCLFTDASTDSDGTVVAWDWNFGDTNTSTLQNPSHTYAAAGTFSVTLTVTDDDGATGSVTQDVTVTEANVAPTAAFSSSCTDLDCLFTDLSSDSDGSVVAWDWNFGDTNTSTLQNPSHTYAAAGTFSVTLTVTDDDGATGSVTQDVTVTEANVAPTAAFSSSCTDLDCLFTDASTDSDGSVVAWDWNFGDTNTSTLQNPSHTYAAAGTFSVTLTVTDDDGATGSVTQDVTVTEANVAPTAAFSSSCTDLNCLFTDASTDSDGSVVAWDWNFGDTNTSTLQNPSHTYAAAGTFSVTLTVTDDDGATGSVTQDVTVTEANVAPTAAFSSSCTDLDCLFTDASTDSDGTVVAWDWNFGDTNTSTAQNPSHTYAAAGTFSVTLTVTDDDGATGSVTQDVTVTEANVAPTAAFSSSCTDLDCLFTDASTDSDGTVVAWDWNFGDTNTSTLQNPSHSYGAGGTYSVTLTVTDDDGATGSVTQDVTVTEANVAPTAAFSSSCTDLDCLFTDLSTDSDGTVDAWSWDFGDTNTSTLQNPSHTYAAAGTFSVTLTVTDDDGATGSVTQDVTVTEANVAPTAAFSSSCTDLDCLFTDASTDSDGTVVAWDWNFGDTNTSTAQNPSHTYAAAGTFSVTLTVTDDDGATGSVTQDVTVTEANVAPTAAFSSSCTDLDCLFTDASTDSDGTVVAWDWNFGDTNTSTLQNPSHTYAAAGTFSVTLTVTDDDGATGSVTQDVTVTEANVAPTAAFSSSCTDLDCLFTDASTDSDGTVVAWDWNFGDTNTSTLQNPSHTYAAAGTFSVTLTVTDDDGATGSVTQDVTVTEANVAPTAAFSSDCTNFNCDFTDLSSDTDGSVVAWNWDFGDGNTSTAQNPSHTYLPAGSGFMFTVTLTVTDDEGATDNISMIVNALGDPNVAPTAAFSLSCTDLDCLFTDLSSDSDGTVVAWDWNFGDTNTSTLQNPSHSYGAGGTYSVTLTVTDDDGATGSVTQDVTVTEANVAPTAAFSSSCTDLDCLFTDTSTDSDGSVVAWDWNFGDTNTSTLQNPSHTYAAAGTFSVTLTVTDDDGATGSVTQDVTVTEANVAPTAAFSSSCTDLDCLFTDTSTDSDGSVVAWDWNFGDTNTSTLQNPSHSYGAGGTFSVTLTVTDDDGATGSVTQDVTVTEANVAPTAAFSPSCTDLDCLFTDLSSDSDGTVVAWDWNFGDTNTSTLQNPSHSYGAGGTYSVTLTVTDDDGATGSVTQDVTVTEANVAPTAAFSSSCTDLDCLFTDTSTDSDGSVVAWDWNFGDTNTSTLQNPSHTYAAAGTFSVTLTVTDDDGATGSVTQDVTVTEANVAPTAAFSSSCTDLDCLFTDLSSDSDGTVVAWDWNFGDTNTSTLQNPSHSYGAGGTYSVTLTVTDDDGATGSVTQDVTVTEANVAPTAAFSSSCTDLDCLFTDTSTDSDGSVVAWDWNFGDTNTSTLQNPSHTYAAAGTFSVTLTVTDDDGATGSVTQDVTVTEANVAPTAAFSSSCTDLDCLFTDLSSDSDGTVVAWDWNFGDTNTSTLQNPSHSYGAGGTFSVTLTVTDDDGATGSVTQDVTVTEANVAPTAAFSPSCTDLDCLFTDLSSDSDGTVVAWDWNFGDTNTSTLQNPSHTYAAAGTFSVTLTVTDDDGATGSVTQDVTVTEANVAPTAAFSSSCTDLDCLFTDLSSDSDGTVVAWDWNFGDTNTSTLQNPSHTYAAAGTFSVTLTVTDDDGATGSVTQDVTVTEANVAPTAAFSSSCTDLDCLFTDASTDSDGTVVAWDWNFGDTNTSTLQNPSHTYAAAGTFSVTLTVTDDDGATGSVTQDVTVTEANVAPTAAFSPSCTDLDCLFTDLSSDSDGTVVAWDWNFGDTNTSTLQNPSHSYGAGGTYSVTLTVTDDDGATGSVTQDVTVTEANVAPTAAFSSDCANFNCDFTDLSSDTDGSVVAWNWDFGDTNTSTLQNPSHSYGAGGTYSVTLTVTDDDGATGSVTQDVTVTEANVAPTAAFSSSCTDLDCLFTDASTDSDGSIASWDWNFGDSNTSTAQSPSHSYAAAGTYPVTLTVTDDDGDTGSVTQDVTVTEANVAPTAAFSSDCANFNCDFTDLSSDTDGSVVAWNWDFGDGNTSTAQNPSHTYLPAGSSFFFTVTLTVTDDKGATNNISKIVNTLF